MKKHINKILILFVAAIFTVACDKDYDYTILNSNAELAVNTSATAVELTKDNIGTDIFTISWTEPDYGFTNENPNYKILFDLAAGDFSEAKTVVTTTELSKTFEVDELNKMLLNLGLEADTASEIQIKVIASVGQKNIESVIKTVTVTPFANVLDLSTIWAIVGSATINGWDGPDMPFFTTSNPDELVAYVTLITGEIKFRSNNSWDVNYGDDGVDGKLDLGGANILVTAGTYRILFNTSSLSYTIESYTWGLVGSATLNSWDGPDMPMTYDSYSDSWKAVVTLSEGEMKFRFNNDWALNYGDDGADGTIDNGGANIVVAPGNYLVILDLKNNEYSLTPIDIWGLVGSAAPNGWDGPNMRFTPDYSKDGVWVINKVTLIDGAIKFRTNDSWDVNYGYSGVEGILGSDDIPVTAGTYDIFLNINELTYELVKL
jgi:hypothetical protein